VATINVTRGCAHGCVYCYAQAYSNYPGHGRVIIYENLAQKIEGELPRKRKKPTRAYFSPSCDPFQPLDAVLDATYDAMRVLLARGVSVAFLTKGVVPERFLDLFRERPGLVHAQIGLATLDASVAAMIEPGAAIPELRLANIRRLSDLGIPMALRIDPLFPFLTDTDENLSALFAEAASAGAKRVAASYLFMRGSLRGRVMSALRSRPAISERMADLFAKGLSLSLYEGGHRVLGLPMEFRRRNHERIARLAAAHGLAVHFCACKNGDVTSDACRIAGEESAAGYLF
jgi:DNA repair photolyase